MEAPLRAWAFAIVVVFDACTLERARVDLNNAPAQQIQELRGIDRADADRIVAGRPYASKEDLLRRHVVSTERYQAIAGDLYVGPPGMPDYLRGVPPAAEGP